MTRGMVSLWIGCAVLLFFSCSIAHAQRTETTIRESHDPAGTIGPARVTVVHSEREGGSFETSSLEIPSINGGFEKWVETEQEVSYPAPGITKTLTRRFGLDGNGRRSLVGVTEEQRSVAPGGRETLVRTESSTDLNGRLQLVEREVEETTWEGENARRTTSELFQQTPNGVQKVRRSEASEHRKGDVTRREVTVLAPDGEGRFVPVSRKESTTTETAAGQVKDERSFGDLGAGPLRFIQREVSRESRDGAGSRTVVETQSAFSSGVVLEPGRLIPVQTVSTSSQTAADGRSSLERQVVSLSKTGYGSVVTLSVKGTPGSGNSQGTRQTLRVADGNGGFAVVQVTGSQNTITVP